MIPHFAASVAHLPFARMLKGRAIRGALGALQLTGVLKKHATRKLRSKALVLMYHRVLAPGDLRSSPSPSGIVVSSSAFEMQIRFLSCNFKILSVEEFLEHLRNKVPFEGPGCLITFDDGWRDNYTHAFPILKKYGAPAVVFLTTGFIGTRGAFWQERLYKFFLRVKGLTWKEIEVVIAEFPELRAELTRILTSRLTLRPEDIVPLTERLKELPGEQIENLLVKFNLLFGASMESAKDEREFLSWDEAREMADGGVSFGSHGVNHTILTVNGDSAKSEIACSKAEIEYRLGKTVSVFSYPNGNHSDRIIRLVKASGYQAAFGTNFGYAAHDGDPFRLARVNVHEAAANSLPLFQGRIAGLC